MQHPVSFETPAHNRLNLQTMFFLLINNSIKQVF